MSVTLNTGDYVQHIERGWYGQVVDISIWWGWYRVKWSDGQTTVYNANVDKPQVRKVGDDD